MDNLETYIKMCKMAEEIQREWCPSHGDYYWGKNSIYEPDFPDILTDERYYKIHLLAEWNSEGGWFHLEPEHIDKTRHTWLPRQDDLQKMVKGFLLRSELVFTDDALSEAGGQRKLQYENIDGLTTIWGDSYEQIWLALVMKEKYGKSWTGTEWKALDEKTI